LPTFVQNTVLGIRYDVEFFLLSVVDIDVKSLDILEILMIKGKNVCMWFRYML